MSSLNPAPRVSGGLAVRCYSALLAGAREASPAVAYDKRGYAPRWEDNLTSGLPVSEIVGDLAAGAGKELDGKLCAAHSSAALAVNAFGPWRLNPLSLRLAGASKFISLRFEVTFPTGLGGVPPHLDLLADGKLPVAVESKCTEWMAFKPPVFSASYDRLRDSHGHSPWFEQVHELRRFPAQYANLDAAQLIKHALGLMARYGSREVLLLYLFWEPRNAESWPECQRHRQDALDLAVRVRNSNIKLIPMSYRDLWVDWERHGVAHHLPYLKTRYDRDA